MAERIRISKRGAAAQEIAAACGVDVDAIDQMIILVQIDTGVVTISSLCCNNHVVEALAATVLEARKHGYGLGN